MDTFLLSFSFHRKLIFDLLTKGQQNLEYADVKIRADGETASAHKFVLAAVSPFLKELLSSSHPESTIILDNTSYDDLRLALQFVYNGEIYTSAKRGQRVGEVLQRLGISLNKKSDSSTSSREPSSSRSLSDHEVRVPRPSSSVSPASGMMMQPVVAIERLDSASSVPDVFFYSCRKCGKSYDKKWHLETHEMAGCNQYPIQCTECDDDCFNYVDLCLHRAYHTGNNECPLCSNSFSSRMCLKLHFLSYHLPSEYLTFKCSVCAGRFSSESLLQRHVKKAHGEKSRSKDVSGSAVAKQLKPKDQLQRLNKCPRCQKTFPNSWIFDAHVATQCEKVFTSCAVCSASVGDFKEFIEHKAKHLLGLICPVCKFNVQRKEMLHGHIFKNHLPEELLLHKCGTCHKKFFNIYLRRSHNKRVHKLAAATKPVKNLPPISPPERQEYTEPSNPDFGSEEVDSGSEISSSSSAPKLKKQKLSEKNEVQKKMACMYCNKELPSHVGLSNHYRSCNVDEFFDAMENQRFACKFCNRAVFKKSLHFQICLPLQAAVKDKTSKESLMKWRKVDVSVSESKKEPSSPLVSCASSTANQISEVNAQQVQSKNRNTKKFRCPGCHVAFVPAKFREHMKNKKSKCRKSIKQLYSVLETGSKQCKLCGYKVSKLYPFVSHLKLCSKRGVDFSHVCVICDCNLTNNENLKRHMADCHGEQMPPLKVEIPLTQVASESAVEKPVSNEVDTIKCLVCEEVFQRDAFVDHIRNGTSCASNMFYTFENDKGLIKCKMCGWKLLRHGDFLRHIRVTCLVASHYDGITDCTICEITLTKSNRAAHYREKHGVVPDDNSTPKKMSAVLTSPEVKCRVCLSVLSDASKLSDHKKKCTFEKYYAEVSENTFECRQCHVVKPKNQRSSHIVACWTPFENNDIQFHSPTEVRCRTCSLFFTDRRVLFNHKLTCNPATYGVSFDQIQCTLCSVIIQKKDEHIHMKNFHPNEILGTNTDEGSGMRENGETRIGEPNGDTAEGAGGPSAPVQERSRLAVHKCGICYQTFEKFHEAVIHRKLCCDRMYSLSADGEFICRHCEKAVTFSNKARHLTSSTCPRGSEARMNLIRIARGESAPAHVSGTSVKLEPNDYDTESKASDDGSVPGVDGPLESSGSILESLVEGGNPMKSQIDSCLQDEEQTIVPVVPTDEGLSDDKFSSNSAVPNSSSGTDGLDVQCTKEESPSPFPDFQQD